MKENIPEFLYEILIKEYGKDLTEKILKGYSEKRATTVRINTNKATLNEVKQEFLNEGILFEHVKWYVNSLIVSDKEKVQYTEAYKIGKIYMQSLSSMIPPLILSPKEGDSILDMCAAPGGKTTQMASLSNNMAMITACEKNKIRAETLKYNLEKQGTRKVTLIKEDARRLSNFFSFDKILLDAPCSGSGTINLNDNNLKKYYTEELLKRSIKTQKELLKKATQIIKKNGEIIYSTCSILKEENEDIINEAVEKFGLKLEPINLENFDEIDLLPTNIKGTMCICPNNLYEGFFVAKLIKE